jgi:hypothetical protein
VTVAAVALIVDGGGLVAADAFLPHVERTRYGAKRLRVAFLGVACREERRDPLGDGGLFGLLGGERRQDRLALHFAGLGRDPSGVHRIRVKVGGAAADGTVWVSVS